jgi:uncharacterized protein (TIRG00374 family)
LVAVVLVLAAALLIGISWSVPVGRIWSALLSTDPWIAFAAMLIVSVSFWIRGWRWALLFRPDYRVGVGSATALASIGLALNAVLPGKAGEAARVALASRRFRCGWAFAAATVVGERLLDAVALLLFLGVALLGLPTPAATSSASLFGYSIDVAALDGAVRNLAVISLLMCALIASLMSKRGRDLLLRALAPLPGLRLRAERPLEEIGRGFKAFQSARVILGGLSQSVLIWFLLALATLVLATGVPGIDLDLRQALGLTAISIVASALPSAPGAWGVFEAAGLLGLTLLSVPFEQSTGVAFVLLMHLSQYLPVLVFGAGSALVSHVSVADVRRYRGHAS